VTLNLRSIVGQVAGQVGIDPAVANKIPASAGSLVILRSKQPIMSPSWSADGRRLAYVSFEKRRSEVYIQDVASGARESVASFPGINGAPAWSPDGRLSGFDPVARRQPRYLRDEPAEQIVDAHYR